MNLKLTKTQKVCRAHGLWPLKKSIKQNDKNTTSTVSIETCIFKKGILGNNYFATLGYGENARKVHVKELVFGKVAGSEPWNFTKN